MLQLGRAEAAVWVVGSCGTAAAAEVPAAPWKRLPPLCFIQGPSGVSEKKGERNNSLPQVALKGSFADMVLLKISLRSPWLSVAGLCEAPPPRSLKSTVVYFRSAAEIDPILR